MILKAFMTLIGTLERKKSMGVQMDPLKKLYSTAKEITQAYLKLSKGKPIETYRSK